MASKAVVVGKPDEKLVEHIKKCEWELLLLLLFFPFISAEFIISFLNLFIHFLSLFVFFALFHDVYCSECFDH